MLNSASIWSNLLTLRMRWPMQPLYLPEITPQPQDDHTTIHAVSQANESDASRLLIIHMRYLPVFNSHARARATHTQCGHS